jgi:hypothetical protein
VYPLKFLFTLVVGGLTGLTIPQEQLSRMITSQHQVPVLMVIYSAGVMAVFILFALLYRYAYQKRTELELNEYESLSTRNAVIHFSGFAGVVVIVAAVAVLVPEKYAGTAGLLFCLNGIWGWIAGSMLGKQERLALERMKASSSSSGAAPSASK